MRHTTLALLLASGLVAQATAAEVVNYSNFCDQSAITRNGVTGSLNPGGVGPIGPNPGDSCVLRLTNDYGQSGSAFLTAPFSLAADASFSSFFSFQMTNQGNGGADGIVFAVQTVSNQAGGGGGGIGYQGLSPSVGIEFDNWFNGGVDPDANHVGIDLNGNMASVVTASPPAEFDDGAIFYAWVDYNGATDSLEVRVALTSNRPGAALLSYNVDLVTLLGTTDAFIGFTSGTGAAKAWHDIRSWIFTGEYNPIDPNPVPEPAPLALLAVAALALALRRRR